MRSSLMPFLLLASLFVSSSVFAQAPDSLSFQGFLTNSSGTALDTTVSLTFKLYKASQEVWSETRSSVTVSDGVFNVMLGQVTPLDTVAFDRPMDIGVAVGEDSEIVPRTVLGSTAFALGTRGLRAVWAVDGSNEAYNLVGGASNNHVVSGVVGAAIGGGGGIRNSIPIPDSVLGNWGTVSGGDSNVAGSVSSVGGGRNNRALAFYSTVSGGDGNSATGNRSTVGGGGANVASGTRSTVAGGYRNVASGLGSTVPGGNLNVADARYTFAAGNRANAVNHGSFVWADDSSESSFSTTADNQFLIRATGGVGIGTNTPGSGSDGFAETGALLDVRRTTGTAVHIGNSDATGLAGPTLRVQNTSTGAGIAGWIISEGTDATLIVQNLGAGDILTAWAGGNRRLRITTYGEVFADSTFHPTGADVAESIDVMGRSASYQPGDVLVVSETADRTVELNNEAYSTRVVGVHATSPGVLLSNEKMAARSGDRIPVGVVGIVPTKVTTENGAIRRGDLLVTSSTPGHAMRADPEHLGFGMVLGKAMEPFEGVGAGQIDVILSVR